MTILHKITRNSRKEGAFIKGMDDEKRQRYITHSLASYHTSLLIPFITITKCDRYWREVHYVIRNGVDPDYKGVTYNARKKSDWLMRLPHNKRILETKAFIADCHPEYMLPFVAITSHDEKWREIHYTVDTDTKRNA